MSHIAMERNRRKQMNEHLKVLRSMTPYFYVKRGDQASIVEGVIDFIKELHQLLESLESKKKRKSTSLSPSPVPSPTGALLLPVHNSGMTDFGGITDSGSQLAGIADCIRFKEVGGAACCNSPIVEVEAKISGSNVILKTISKTRVNSGQIARTIQLFESLALDINYLNISSMDDSTVVYSFILKIGLECAVSMEELVLEVHKSFSPEMFQR